MTHRRGLRRKVEHRQGNGALGSGYWLLVKIENSDEEPCSCCIAIQLANGINLPLSQQKPKPHLSDSSSNFGALGGHGLGDMGPAAITWVPMGAQAPVWSPNDHPNPSQGQQKGLGKS